MSEICRSRRIFVCVSIDDNETNKREVHNLEEDKEELEEEEDRELKMVSELVGGKEEAQRGSCLQS